MATKTRAKGARTTARRSKPAARKRAVKRGKAPKRGSGRATGGGTKKRPSRTRRPAAKAAVPRKAARPAATGAASRELATLKVRFQREKTTLEKRLTESVREIGQLRHHEARAAQLERQLKERDETIGQLRSQLSELRNRELAPPEDEEVQPSLALGEREPNDLDFDEEVDPEDDELI